MVHASFEYGRESGTIAMKVRGHAGFAQLGKDPVCAGASVLALTAAQVIQSMHEEGKLARKPNIVIRDGRVTVVAKPKPEHFEEALHTFYVAETGMGMLAQAYPEHCRFTPFIEPEKGCQ